MAQDEFGNEIDDGNDPASQLPAGARQHLRSVEKELAAARDREAAKDQELAKYARRDAFEAAMAEAKVEGVTIADVGELPADQISPALLQAKASEKQRAATAVLGEQAKASGFVDAAGNGDVTAFQAALAQVQAANRQRTADLGSLAGAIGGAAGGPPVTPPDTRTPEEQGRAAFKAAIEAGKSKDRARSDMIEAQTIATMRALETPSAPAGF